MKYLKLFEGYQSESEIREICIKYNIENWSINSEGLVDVDGDVNIFGDIVREGSLWEELTKIPLKFGNVSGDFLCYKNQLTSLEGCPHTIGGDFDCAMNKLTSLEYAPHTVGGDFDIGDNQLTSLKGGCPNSISGYFDCSKNKLKSLEGCPQEVGDDFHCHNNNIYSFEGYPKYIKGNFNSYKNPIYKIWRLIDDKSYSIDYQIIELLNDYDCIRDNGIILDRFNDFLQEIGKKPMKKVEGYKNT